MLIHQSRLQSTGRFAAPSEEAIEDDCQLLVGHIILIVLFTLAILLRSLG